MGKMIVRGREKKGVIKRVWEEKEDYMDGRSVSLYL